MTQTQLNLELERRRFYLATHKRIPPEHRNHPSELDRMYAALTVAASYIETGEVDDEDLRECVVCPLCGWVSKPFTWPCDRLRYFSTIARILMSHIHRKHPELCERIANSEYHVWGADRAKYRCKLCGAQENGVIEILAHYFDKHYP